MKILHTSDWHLGKSLYDFPLIDDQRRALDFLLSLISGQDIDAVIIAGDVYDRPVPPAEAVRLYDRFLSLAAGEMGVPVIAVAGNHDSASRLEFGSSLYRQSGYYVSGGIRKTYEPVVLEDKYGKVFVHPIPYFHPAEARALFEGENIKSFDDAYRVLLAEYAKNIDPAERNIAVAHGYIAPVSSSDGLVTSDSEVNIGGMEAASGAYFKIFDYTALGHLHAPQRAGGETIRYSGSPLKYSLSEENQKKSCTIVELLEKGNINTNLVPIPALRDVRSVTGSFDELLEPSFHENKNFDDYVFANITDSGILYPMEKLRTLFPNLLGLRFSDGEDMRAFEPGAVPGGLKLSALELFCRFYRDSKGEELSGEKLEFSREVIAKSEVEPE